MRLQQLAPLVSLPQQLLPPRVSRLRLQRPPLSRTKSMCAAITAAIRHVGTAIGRTGIITTTTMRSPSIISLSTGTIITGGIGAIAITGIGS